MDIVFRKLPPVESLTPQPGEIYLVPASRSDADRRALASFVLAKGEAGLVRFNGPLDRIVVDVDPKLDDMLAASILKSQLEQKLLPQDLAEFCRYTAQVRDGIRPTATHLEQSLEGIFLAMRAKIEKRLSDYDTGQRFLADWKRLADAIFAAAKQQLSPFVDSLFGAGVVGGTSVPLKSVFHSPAAAAPAGVEIAGQDFSAEIALLEKDREVYRADFERAERGHVRSPKTGDAIAGLVLREPKSLFLKSWTRSPCPAPMGGPYPFLAIKVAPGQWVFSIDPSRHVSLKPLAERLQAAEAAATPGRTDHVWYDGASIGHTQVASPRGGTSLSDDAVLGVLSKWGWKSATASKSRFGVKAMAAAGLLLIVVAASLAVALRRPNDTGGGALIDVHDLYVLSVGVSDYKNLPALPNAAPDADALAAAFQNQKGKLCPLVTTKVLKNTDATRSNILDYALPRWLLEQQRATRRSLVILTFSGHGFLEPGTNRYHFAPQDYDPQSQGSTGIFLADLQRYLAELPCPSIVMFDTCHSGGIDESDDDTRPEQLIKTMQKAVHDTRDSKGLVVMAACGRYQKANETARWKHGALTLSVLEGISGKSLYEGKSLFRTPFPKPGPGGVITLKDLDSYVTERVEALASEISDSKYRRQVAKTFAIGNLTLDRIPIAVQN